MHPLQNRFYKRSFERSFERSFGRAFKRSTAESCKRCSILLIMCLLSLMLTNTAFAITNTSTKMENLTMLRNTAKTYIEANIDVESDEKLEVTIGHLDSRLQLPACRSPLNFTEPMQTKRLGTRTLLIRCMDKQPWQIYLSAQVKVLKPVIVAATSLYKGQTIQMDQLVFETQDIARLRMGYFTDPNQLIGKSAKMSIISGSVLTPSNIVSPRLIKRGQQVDIVARGQGIEVHHKGVAMADGILGESISVKNLASKRIVEGQVTENGEVRVSI